MNCELAIREDKCKAECCGCIPISDVTLNRFDNLKQENGETIRVTEKESVIVTMDGLCTFLDRKTRQCMIYNDRPEICQKYGLIDELVCPCFDKDGVMRTRADRKRTQRTIDKKVVTDLKALVAKK